MARKPWLKRTERLRRARRANDDFRVLIDPHLRAIVHGEFAADATAGADVSALLDAASGGHRLPRAAGRLDLDGAGGDVEAAHGGNDGR